MPEIIADGSFMTPSISICQYWHTGPNWVSGPAASHSPQQIPALAPARPPAASTAFFHLEITTSFLHRPTAHEFRLQLSFFPLHIWHFIFKSRLYLIISEKLACSRPKLTPGLWSMKILWQIFQPFSDIMLSILTLVYYSVAHTLCESYFSLWIFTKIVLTINFDTILIKTMRKTLYILSDLAFVTGFLTEVVKTSSVREAITKYQRDQLKNHLNLPFVA